MCINVFISIFCNTSQALASVMLVMTNSSVIKTEWHSHYNSSVSWGWSWLISWYSFCLLSFYFLKTFKDWQVWVYCYHFSIIYLCEHINLLHMLAFCPLYVCVCQVKLTEYPVYCTTTPYLANVVKTCTCFQSQRETL